MSTTTAHLGLVKPDPIDGISISVINGNMDTLDTAVFNNTAPAPRTNSVTVGGGGGFSVDGSQYDFITVNLTSGANTVSATGFRTGQLVRVAVKQNATGGATITWPVTGWKYPGGTAPVITTTASAEDIVDILYDGVSYIGKVATANVH
jgi:hypothetical protein